MTPLADANERCLYTVLYAPRERIEGIVLDGVAPIVAELGDDPSLDSLFYVRYSEPEWQLRLRVLGRPDWIEGPVRTRVTEWVGRLVADGIAERPVFTTYDREWERYGGPEGMRLAEKLFFADTLACLALLDADRRGAIAKTRREVSLLLVDGLLDLARFTHAERAAFYRTGYDWALRLGTWTDRELAILGERYETLRPGLAALFAPEGGDRDRRWGGEEPRRIADGFFARSQPIVDAILTGHRAGRITGTLTELFWSYAHMMTNRLGIESSAEAILRFFMHRFVEDTPADARR